MSGIDVGTPGYAIDITCAEFKFDGQTLSAAIESCEINIKQEEEQIHLQGEEEPSQRTVGQRSYDLSLVWATRQMLRFMDLTAGGDLSTFQRKEFELTLHGRPKDDPNLYEFAIGKLRFLNHGFNLDKSFSKDKVTASCLTLDTSIISE